MHILIIDDDAKLRLLLRRILEQDGFSVSEAGTGAEGLARFVADAPDIVLLDRVLPDVDGAELCAKFKHHPTILPPYIILLSALRTGDEEVAIGLEQGGDDYLRKPVSRRILLARIHAAVRIKRAEAALRRTNVELIASEERYRKTFDLANIGIAQVAPSGRFLQVNQHLAGLLGYTPQDLRDRHLQEVVHPEDLPHLENARRAALHKGVDRFHMEPRWLRKDGGVLRLDLNATLVYGLDGEAEYFIFALRDITKRREMETRLQRSEAAFRTLVEHSPDLIARFDRSLRYTYVSPASAALVHLAPETLQGKTNRDIDDLPPDVAEYLDTAIQEAFRTGEKQRIEFSLSIDGEERHFETHLRPEMVQGQGVETVLSITRDVTERVVMEAQIRRLATVLEQAQIGVVITDPTGAILYANPYMTQMTGYAVEELVGQNPRLLKSGRMPDSFYAQLWRTLNAGQTWEGVFLNRRKSGALYYDASVIFPIRDRYGRLNGYAAVKQDITERMAEEREREVMISISAALRHADTRAQMLPAVGQNIQTLLDVDGVAFAMAMVDAEKNDAVIEWAGGAFENLVGVRFRPDEGVIGYVLATGETYVTEDAHQDPLVRYREALGDVRTLVAVPMLAQHNIIGVLIIGREEAQQAGDLRTLTTVADITASAIYRADLFAALQEYAANLEKRVAERTQELAVANEELKALERMKSKFVADVSHELRTPLASMELYLDLLEQGKPEKREEYRQALHQAVQRLAQIVEDILDLSYVETTPIESRRLSPVDLCRVVEDEVQVHWQRAEAAGLELTYELPSERPYVLGDYNQLARLLGALLLNGIKYTPQGRVHVQVSVEPETNTVLLTVQDTGIGIKQEDLPHVFERFYRGDHGLLAIPGTGLGLSIAKEIVAFHGGHIHLESTEGVGTTVQVRLPLSVSEEPGGNGRVSPTQVRSHPAMS